MNKWHEMTVAETALELGTDVKAGKLNLPHDRKRRSKNNVFRFPLADASAVVKKMSSDAALLLLAVTYLIAAFGERLNESLAGIALIAVFFVIGCYIKYRSSKRIENAYRILLPTAKVTEEGNGIRLSIFDVEVGDLISFSKGDIIPADARLVSSRSLKIAERSFDEVSSKTTYVSIKKNAEAVVSDDAAATYENMVYAGSMVISGSGTAIVTAVGDDTRLSNLGGSISVAPENDLPEYLRKFNKETKFASLLILAALIPVALIGIFRQTSASSRDFDILYMFITALALAVTCMSELVSLSAESLVTKEILPSSRVKRAVTLKQSKITRLSAAEVLSETDTVLILTPEILIDKTQKVRQVFFAGNNFRFGSLTSKTVSDLAEQLLPFYGYLKKNSLSSSETIIKSYLTGIVDGAYALPEDRPVYVRDPSHSTRVCVFERDAEKRPVRFIAQSCDFNMVRECTSFRTEGGGVWKMDKEIFSKALKWFNANTEDGRYISVYVSSDGADSPSVFEGMIAVGHEYPYADGNGDLALSLEESGISPILVLEDQSDESLNIIRKCGLIGSNEDTAIASEYSAIGMSVADAPIDTKAYVGFGNAGTAQIFARLAKNGRNVLPIIKDSSHRQSLNDHKIYAVHDTESHDLIKISASVDIQPVDTENGSGGLSDALNMIKRSAMARLKLGVYRNYLLFSLLMRVFCVALPMVFGNMNVMMSSVMILFAGFVCDYLALLVIMYANGLPVRSADTAEDANRLFSPALLYMYLASAFVSSGFAVIIANQLISAGKLMPGAAPWFMFYALIASVLLSIGAFLLILMKRSRKFAFNIAYASEIAVFAGFLIAQAKLPAQIMAKLGIPQFALSLLPSILLCAAISFVSVFVIDKILSLISSWHK